MDIHGGNIMKKTIIYGTKDLPKSITLSDKNIDFYPTEIKKKTKKAAKKTTKKK